MRHTRLSTARTARLCGGLLLAAAVPASAAVDGKLLDMLLANGSITAAQHAELSADLARETKAAERTASKQVKSEEMTALQQKLDWALKTQLKGDVRVRYENIHIEDEADNGGRDKDRQRIRARLGAFTQVNPEVEAGIQIASGGGKDARSTNQDLSDYFNKKDLWLDLAYIDFHPLQVPGLKVFGGKMKQPWVSMGDVIWDGDINPEGGAVTYKRLFGGTEVFGSAGYYVLQDNIDGEGVQFEHDLRLYAGQVGTRFFPGDSFKVTLGGSVYAYDDDEDSAALRVNGNTTDQFRLVRGFRPAGRDRLAAAAVGVRPVRDERRGPRHRRRSGPGLAGRGDDTPVRRRRRLQLPRCAAQRRGRCLHRFGFRRRLRRLAWPQAQAQIRREQELLDRDYLFHGRVRCRQPLHRRRQRQHPAGGRRGQVLIAVRHAPVMAAAHVGRPPLLPMLNSRSTHNEAFS